MVSVTSGCLPDQLPHRLKTLYLPGEDEMRVDSPARAIFGPPEGEARK